MKIQKLHLLRIILSALFTVMFLRVIAVMITLSKYILTRLLLDAAQYQVAIETSFDSSITWFINIYYYIIFFVVIFVVWHFFGLPNELGVVKKFKDMGDFFSGYMPYEEDEKTDEEKKTND